MSRIERLTAEILRDRERRAATAIAAIAATGRCFLCGRAMIYCSAIGDNSGRFCSDRCRNAYDDGFRVQAEPDWFGMRKASVGFYIRCRHCRKEFESRGLAYCSDDCFRAYRETKENEAVMAEVGMDVPSKRTCLVCEAIIPKWGKRGKTPSNRLFCSAKCAARHRRSKTS